MIAYTDDITSTRLPASRVLSEVAALHFEGADERWGKKMQKRGKRGRSMDDEDVI